MRILRKGFTLVELLVVLSILVLVSGVLTTTVRGGMKAWKRVECVGGQNENMLIAFQDMRKHLQNYHRFDLIPFDGGFNEMHFPSLVATEVDGVERMEPGQVNYYINESKGYLCRSEFPYRELSAYRYKDSCSMIAEDVERLRFQYYVYNTEEKEFRWANSWESNSPPFLVKVELSCYDSCNDKNIDKTFTIFLPQASLR